MLHKHSSDAMASGCIHVALMSGRAVAVSASTERPLKYVRLQAQGALQTGHGVLRDEVGRVLDDSKTVGEVGLGPGDVLTLQVRQTMLASSKCGSAFATMFGNGSVVTWGA